MKKILIFGRLAPQSLNERLQKLGYEIAEHPHHLLDFGPQLHKSLAGKVDVILYHVCSCCQNQFDHLSKLSFCDNPEWTIPVVLVRGGDFAGQGHMILGALQAHTSTDEDFKLAIDSAIKMAERFKAMGTV